MITATRYLANYGLNYRNVRPSFKQSMSVFNPEQTYEKLSEGYYRQGANNRTKWLKDRLRELRGPIEEDNAIMGMLDDEEFGEKLKTLFDYREKIYLKHISDFDRDLGLMYFVYTVEKLGSGHSYTEDAAERLLFLKEANKKSEHREIDGLVQFAQQFLKTHRYSPDDFKILYSQLHLDKYSLKE